LAPPGRLRIEPMFPVLPEDTGGAQEETEPMLRVVGFSQEGTKATKV
jgi:hypothetical protein